MSAEIVRKARLWRDRIMEINTEKFVGDGGGCVVSTLGLLLACFESGCPVIMQAGSLYWPFVDPGLDDGVSATHFSYVWEDEKFGEYWANPGMLWEMHAWGAILPDTLIDLETGNFKKQHRRILGLPWTAKDPPDYLWGVPPAGALYEPSATAILFLRKLHGQLVRLAEFGIKTW